MAQEPLATKGNYLHIYDFRVQKGHEEEFIRSFEKFDYSDGNPMHKSKAQVKDGVLCRDTEDPQRFFLIAEWADIEEHARIRRILAEFFAHLGSDDAMGVGCDIGRGGLAGADRPYGLVGDDESSV